LASRFLPQLISLAVKHPRCQPIMQSGVAGSMLQGRHRRLLAGIWKVRGVYGEALPIWIHMETDGCTTQIVHLRSGDDHANPLKVVLIVANREPPHEWWTPS